MGQHRMAKHLIYMTSFLKLLFFFGGGGVNHVKVLQHKYISSGGVGHLHCSSNMIGTPPKKTTLTEHDFLNVTICWEWHKRILVGGFNPVEKYINILVKMEIIPK